MKLDEIDAKILKYLQENARRSFREIGKSIGVSTPTVSSRIKMLEEQGVIRRYSAMVDTEAIQETTSIIYVECQPRHLDKLAKNISEKENVREVLVLSGSKIMCRFVSESEGMIDSFLAWLESLEEISSYSIDRVIRTTKREPDAVISEGISIVVPCYECGKPIIDDPVTLKMDGRTHYLCCESCLKLYQERYERIKSGITPKEASKHQS
ncbi:MAG: winged helix-turn-helix transcriptional regulator [Thermoplasmata archaeon]